MTRAGLWTKHRGIAYKIARDYYAPGCDQDDMRQEALVALWEATGIHDPAKGRFPTFAAVVIRRHLINIVRAATCEKRNAQTVPLSDGNEPAAPEPPPSLDGIRGRLHLLTPLERKHLADRLNDVPTSKSQDNALARARRKLREAA